jgi:hypothetical protein
MCDQFLEAYNSTIDATDGRWPSISISIDEPKVDLLKGLDQ